MDVTLTKKKILKSFIMKATSDIGKNMNYKIYPYLSEKRASNSNLNA